MTNHAAEVRAAVSALEAALFAPEGTRTAMDPLHAYSAVVERVVRAVWATEVGTGSAALVALGSLARGVLGPYADVDLLVVHDGAQGPQALAAFFRALWDAGLRPAERVRTLAEQEAALAADDHVQTAYLEARFLSPWAPAVQAHAAFLARVDAGDGRALFLAKSRERDTRVARAAAPSHRVEPDVKRGAGGIRDVHMLMWTAACLGGAQGRASPWAWLASAGALSAADAAQMPAAVATLLSAAARAHLVHGRAEPRLRADTVQELAARFACRPADVMRPVHAAGRVVERAVRGALDALCGSTGMRAPGTGEGPRLAAPDTTWFDPDVPVPAPLGWGPFTWAERSDTLDALSPHLGHTMGLTQRGGYHDATVSAHLARTADAARAWLSGDTACMPDVLSACGLRVERRAAFVFAALMHDAAKGTGADHAVLGAVWAKADALRIGFSPEDAGFVAFLVEAHLLLSQASQRRDLSDPAVLATLADRVGSRARLDALVALTALDIAAVAPGMLSSWKVELLALLHRRVAPLLSEDPAPNASAPAGAGAVDPFWAGASVRYREGRLQDDVSAEQAAFAAWVPGTTRATFSDVPGGSSTRLVVVTPDRLGLLADVTAVLAKAGVDILRANVDQRGDDVAIDTFRLSHAGGPLALDVVERVRPALERLHADTPVRVHQSPVPRATRRHGMDVRVKVLPPDTWGARVLELRGPDRPGLLAALCAVVAAHAWSITQAKLTTEGPRVIDVFWLVPAQHAARGPSPRAIAPLDALADALHDVLRGDVPKRWPPADGEGA